MDTYYIICSETGYCSDKETDVIGITNDLSVAENKIKEFQKLEVDYVNKVNNFMNDKIIKDKINLSTKKFNEKYRFILSYIKQKNDIIEYTHHFPKTRFEIIQKKNNVFDFVINENFDFVINENYFNNENFFNNEKYFNNEFNKSSDVSDSE